MGKKRNQKYLRNKGRLFEFWTRKMISSVFNIPLDNVIINSKSAPGTDVKVSSQYLDKFPFAVECKNSKRLSFNKAILQTLKNAKDDNLYPLLISKYQKTVWVTIPLEIFIVLLNKQDITLENILKAKAKIPTFKEAKLK